MTPRRVPVAWCPTPHGTVDGCIVVFTFVSFLIASQINSNEPPAVASCDDLANFASHRVSSLARKTGTLYAHCMGSIAGIHQSIGGKMCDRPSAIYCGRLFPWSHRPSEVQLLSRGSY